MATETDTTSSPEPHRLTGSSAPTGDAPSFQAVSSTRSPVQASSRRTDDQVKLIRHANRVIETAKEERKACNVVSDIEDKTSQHRFSHCPQRDGSKPGAWLPELPSAKLREDLGRSSFYQDRQALLPARIEAMEAYEREHAAFCETIGFDAAQQRHDRLFQKLKSQTAALSKMRATCVKALALKSCAYIEIILAGTGDTWIEDLAASIAHDAADIGVHGSRAVGLETLDAHLLDLIARHETALVEQHVADDVADKCDAACRAENIKRPAELYWRATDGPVPSGREDLPNGNLRCYYREADIDAMRTASAPVCLSTGPADSPEGAGLAARPDVRAADRRAKILAAWDAWQAEIEAVRDRTGATAACKAASVAWERSEKLEDALMAIVPMTQAGLVAKARWLTDKGWDKDYLGELALKIVKDIASSSAVAFEAPVADNGHAPDRRALEAYAEWLDMERRLLTIELFPEMGIRATTIVPTGTAARNYHYPLDADFRSASPPSSRAEEMLHRLGIDWRAEDENTMLDRRDAYGDLADGLVPLMGEVA